MDQYRSLRQPLFRSPGGPVPVRQLRKISRRPPLVFGEITYPAFVAAQFAFRIRASMRPTLRKRLRTLMIPDFLSIPRILLETNRSATDGRFRDDRATSLPTSESNQSDIGEQLGCSAIRQESHLCHSDFTLEFRDGHVNSSPRERCRIEHTSAGRIGKPLCFRTAFHPIECRRQSSQSLGPFNGTTGKMDIQP